VTGDRFLTLSLVAGFAGLVLAWWIATRLAPTPSRPAGLDLPPAAARPVPGRVDVARTYRDALARARQETTAALVDVARVDPSAEGVFAWAAAHRVLAERGVTPLPLVVRQAARR
jgi:hypothetical protein